LKGGDGRRKVRRSEGETVEMHRVVECGSVRGKIGRQTSNFLGGKKAQKKGVEKQIDYWGPIGEWPGKECKEGDPGEKKTQARPDSLDT